MSSAARALDRAALLRAYHAEARRYYQRQEQRDRAPADSTEPGAIAARVDALRGEGLDVLTSHTSARDLSAAELDLVVRYLRRQGATDGRARGGAGNGTDRPTAAQWASIARLARARGWEAGLEDPRLLAFVVRTACVAAVRFIDRRRATAIITGLERWAAQSPAERAAE